MKKQYYDYEEVRIHTPELPDFTVTGAVDEVELALQSFGRLKEVSSSRFDKAVYGLPEQPNKSWQLGRLSLALS